MAAKQLKSRTFTEEQFVREVFVGGFLGAYKFWKELKENPHLDGDGLLRAFGLITLANIGSPRTPEEREAFEYVDLVKK